MAARKKTSAKKTVKKTVARTKPAAKTAVKRPARSAKKKTATRTAAKTTKLAPASARKTVRKAVPKATRKTPSKLTAAEQLREYQRKRDFEKTAEPSGATTRKRASTRTPATDTLRFVIQKHDASHLHYDLRLEIDGVMKSWAVPKGPSADPSVKRLAMQVEDHPIDYNTFEGTIPAGEYGGGTVMLWDNGTYEIENAPDDDTNSAARDGHERGEMKVVFHGKRIKGSYALVRTHGMGSSSAKPSWLLIKHRDEQARPESDSSLTGKYMKSVTTGRTMEEISEGSRVWHSSR
jgi:bifunctional non-homologous end joining protein LigD